MTNGKPKYLDLAALRFAGVNCGKEVCPRSPDHDQSSRGEVHIPTWRLFPRPPLLGGEQLRWKGQLCGSGLVAPERHRVHPALADQAEGVGVRGEQLDGHLLPHWHPQPEARLQAIAHRGPQASAAAAATRLRRRRGAARRGRRGEVLEDERDAACGALLHQHAQPRAARQHHRIRHRLLLVDGVAERQPPAGNLLGEARRPTGEAALQLLAALEVQHVRGVPHLDLQGGDLGNQVHALEQPSLRQLRCREPAFRSQFHGVDRPVSWGIEGDAPPLQHAPQQAQCVEIMPLEVEDVAQGFADALLRERLQVPGDVDELAGAVGVREQTLIDLLSQFRECRAQSPEHADFNIRRIALQQHHLTVQVRVLHDVGRVHVTGLSEEVVALEGEAGAVREQEEPEVRVHPDDFFVLPAFLRRSNTLRRA
mmetsp:Transcript_158835/g.509238  ORF Transcript_158835/g.509238 Transcript_158835/m.509238 type:complete len:424 (-) Transcript_158835:941-2212(-)